MGRHELSLRLPTCMGEYDEFWGRCQRALPDEHLGARYTVRRVGNAQAISETLLDLVVSGQKTGLFTRLAELEAAGLMHSAGDYVIFTDYADQPRCLVRMQECKRLKFSEVGPEHTSCESPAARDIEVWRSIHRGYWTPVLAAEGAKFREDIPILFQRFKLLYVEHPPDGKR